MYFQQTLNPPLPTHAGSGDEADARDVHGAVSFSSGLVLYWLTNNVLSIAQQWWITRQI